MSGRRLLAARVGVVLAGLCWTAALLLSMPDDPAVSREVRMALVLIGVVGLSFRRRVFKRKTHEDDEDPIPRASRPYR